MTTEGKAEAAGRVTLVTQEAPCTVRINGLHLPHTLQIQALREGTAVCGAKMSVKKHAGEQRNKITHFGFFCSSY